MKLKLNFFFKKNKEDQLVIFNGGERKKTKRPTCDKPVNHHRHKSY